MKVYIVETNLGDSETRDVDSIWSTKEKAEAYIAKNSLYNKEFENEKPWEEEIDPYTLESIRVITWIYINSEGKINTWWDGTIRQSTETPPYVTTEGFQRYYPYFDFQLDRSRRPISRKQILFAIFTEDRKLAQEIATKIYNKIITNGVWGDEVKTKELLKDSDFQDV